MERDRRLAEARQSALRDQQVPAIGTLAAGAPRIDSVCRSRRWPVVVRELERSHGADPGLNEELKLQRAQVNHCKRIISEIAASPGAQCRRRDNPAARRISDVRHRELDGAAAWRACLLRMGRLAARAAHRRRAHIGPFARIPASQPLSMDRQEWEHIQKVLAEHLGNVSATARSLAMHRRTLQRKLAKRAPSR